MSEVSASDIRRAAMDLLARREQSRLELAQKLNRRFSSADELIEQALDKLRDEGLQSDTRLAEAFIRARTNKGQGPVKIRMELKQKGVDEGIISLAFESAEVDWFALARSVALRKFARNHHVDSDVDCDVDCDVDSGAAVFATDDMKEKARIARFLQQRGFTFDHISGLY